MTASRAAVFEEGDRLAGLDFARHNADVVATWEAYRTGRPTRTPIIVGANTRFFMLHPRANPDGLDFRRYIEDPDTMFDALLQFQRWSRMNLLQDAPLGLPERWEIAVDFQNFYEAAWFGCPLVFPVGEVPDTRPAFAACPERVMEQGPPAPFAGLMARALEYHQHFTARAAKETYLDRPIAVRPPGCGLGTDGPFTAACNLFGSEFACLTLASDPDRLLRLLDFITQAIVGRMEAWRRLFGIPAPQEGFGAADDSIALISTRMYREHVMPFHRRLYDRLGTLSERSIHLCGNATRHFVTLRDALGIQSFDTGFPVDFGRLRHELGPEIRIQGGPHIELLRTASPEAVRAETERILQSGVLEGGLFVLREGNNLAPGTPLENIEAMYRAGRDFGWRGPREEDDRMLLSV